MSIAEYEAKFTELARFAPHMIDTDYKKAQKFEGGLDLDIFNRVGVLKLPTYVDVLDRALMVEANLAAKKQFKVPITEWKGKRSGYGFRKGRSFVNKKQNTGSTSSSRQSSRSIPVCPECGRKHQRVCCRASNAYFRCGKMGHVVRDCLLRSKNADCLAASSAESASTARTNTRANTGKETLRQDQVFALVPGDVQNTEAVVSGSMVCTYVYPACDIVIGGMTLYIDLLPLGIDHFDYILGINWLTKYCASIDCVNKSVVFRPPELAELMFAGNGGT
ncbi:uncharacterized protein LOC114273926 [Camellia sinensis]|uniref:uncharacterized protein LOC114273926 n=1 Tax=Camellia sinensis TaxID=4442 RepID=UPI0010367091|nr:uncharacterized protein LOC114273926 [Camellia sinensis]